MLDYGIFITIVSTILTGLSAYLTYVGNMLLIDVLRQLRK